MTQQILSTKLYYPTSQTNWVRRGRLINKLNECFHARLTIVSAPAGFGKTTLLSEWIEQSKYPVGWVSLDAGDNDPKRFLTYCIAALQKIQSEFGKNTLTIITSPQQVSQESLITAFINEINENLKDSVLVLDDYHLIDSPQVHQSLSFLIEHLPKNLHLVISGRHDPPIPLSRLRARKQLLELRESDLRFTTEETVSFFRTTMDLTLNKEEIDTLDERTEGWIASLQLAGIAMQSGQNIHRFISDFKGSHNYIVDYLTEEVLNHLDSNLQEFLLYTSILTRFNSALCDAVTRGVGSQDVINHLNKAKLFIVPLDESRMWFRYHHLFGDLLKYRLEQLFPDIVSSLHQRASKWFEENGYTEDALNHALSANDTERASSLIETASVQTLVNAEFITLRNWTQKIPFKILEERAYVLICLAWIHNIFGEIEKTGPLLDKTKNILELKKDTYDEYQQKEISAHIALISSYNYSPFYSNNPADVEIQRKLILEAKKLLSEDNPLLQSTIELLLGWTYAFTGNWKEAKDAFMNAFVFGEIANNHIVAVSGAFNYIDILLIEGKLGQAYILSKDITEKYIANYGKNFLSLAFIYLGMSKINYEINNLESADYYASECMRLSKLMGNWTLFFHAITKLQIIRQTNGDAASVKGLMKEDADAWHNQKISHFRELLIETQRTSVLLKQNNLKRVSKWYEKYKSYPLKEAPYHINGKLLEVRILIEKEKYDEALNLLKDAEEKSEKTGAKGFLLEALILKAVLYEKQNETTPALETINKALALAEPEGYIRTFINEGKAIADLLNLYMAYYSKEKNMSYVTKLLEEVNKELSKSTQPVEEPLSDREIEVLRLLSSGYSNQEIADKLFLAVGTIKKHTHQIYQKLNVDSRVKAIKMARELNLI